MIMAYVAFITLLTFSYLQHDCIKQCLVPAWDRTEYVVKYNILMLIVAMK